MNIPYRERLGIIYMFMSNTWNKSHQPPEFSVIPKGFRDSVRFTKYQVLPLRKANRQVSLVEMVNFDDCKMIF